MQPLSISFAHPLRVGAAFILSAAGMFCLACSLEAQPTAKNADSASQQPVQHTITANQPVAVRSGGNEKFYATIYLRPGATVEVLRESKKFPGWLEIRPPAGSFSWINSRFVKKDNKFVGHVATDENHPVPTRVGSLVEKHKDVVPNVNNQKRLSRGTLLILLGEKEVPTADGAWLAVAPAPGEVRYIPASAIGNSKGRAVPPPTGANSPTALIAQADRAFQNRNWCGATQLYLQAADRSRDHGQKIYCYKQLSKLRTVGGGVEACLNQPGHPQHTAVRRQPGPFRFANNGKRIPSANPQAVGTPRTTLKPAAQTWSQWGTLRRARFTFEGRPMYVLVDGRGQPITYAATTSKMTLEPYVNRRICLYGARRYRSDRYFRNYFVLVSHVAVP